jgi:hypothetical protein
MKKFLAPAIAAVALVGLAIAASSMTAPNVTSDLKEGTLVSTADRKEDCGSCPDKKAMAVAKEDCGSCPESKAMAASEKEDCGGCPSKKGDDAAVVL